MDYKQTYELWLNSPALSEAEKAELAAFFEGKGFRTEG